MIPNFIIVGAQKAGTSSMMVYLSEHPEIFIPLEEMHYFDIDKNYKKGMKWYEKKFKKWNGEKAVGEKSPLYIYVENVPARIAKVLPNVKLIFMLRNPVDRAWSDYWANVRKGRDSLIFQEGLANEEIRIKKGFKEKRIYSYKNRGKYVIQIKNFAKYFPKSQMHFVITEQLKNNPKQVLREIYKFLGVDENFILPILYKKSYNIGKIPRSKMFAYLIYNTPINKIDILRRVLNYINTKENPYRMDPESRDYLNNYFEKSNKELAEYLNVDLSIWGR